MNSQPKEIRIDLYSDTLTKPSEGMRAFMAQAEVGDEQKREDPTTLRLEAEVCELLGTEAAVFLPSGTMCNQIAVRLHCRPGEEIILDRTAHIRNYEAGGAAALSGACLYPLDGDAGIFTAAQVEAAIRPAINHSPHSRLLVVEQTSNGGGGTIWPLETMEDVCATAKKHGLACHMDGARLLNAVVETKIAARCYSAPFDTVWIDFSKGLGAPVGAALAGSVELIDRAWRWKHQFGGAMRQSGVIAAAGIYALKHNVERLLDDHAKARALAAGLEQIEGIAVEPETTNMVFFDVGGLGRTAGQFNEALLGRGLRVSTMSATRCRAVPHLDISRAQVEEAVHIIGEVAREFLAPPVPS